MLYLERVLSFLSESPIDEDRLNRGRERLQAMLRESNLYRVQFVLGKTLISFKALFRIIVLKKECKLGCFCG